MGQRAKELLAGWVAENAHAVPQGERQSEAARLVAEFAAYAKDADLGAADLAELEEDIEEDLLSYMQDAVEAAAASQD